MGLYGSGRVASVLARVSGGLAIAVVLLVLIEGVCSFIRLAVDYRTFRRSLPVASKLKEEFHCRHDPEIGWVNIPGKRLEDFYGPGRGVTIDRHGFRAGSGDLDGDRGNRLRVVCLGDSFTFGYGLDDANTFPAQLEAANPSLQVINMGQGGYSVGQCYLWYKRDGRPLKPDVVLLAMIPDDIWRMRETRMLSGYAKPSFALRDGALHVSGQPLPAKIPTGKRFLPDGALARFLVERNAVSHVMAWSLGRRSSLTEDIRRTLNVSMVIVETLHRECIEESIFFVLALMPDHTNLFDPAGVESYAEVRDIFAQFAAQRGILFCDLHPAFLNGGLPDAEGYFLDEEWRHYNEAGARLVAMRIDRFLAANLPRSQSPLDTEPASR